ncbi:MAG TPA: hypothetical protein VGZ47_23900 [Gemmataceae bacterium]|jgi:hypothetical protein|nr:hypothetical protein [Gemmataceae bacterium]
MVPSPLLIRAAVKLREAYVQRAVYVLEQNFLKRMSEFERQKQTTSAWLRQAADDGWANCSLPLRRHLGLLVQSVERAAADMTAQLQQPLVSVPDLRSLIDELQQVDLEFGGLEFELRKKYFSVATEPITLEDVYLGDFDIRLCWNRLHKNADSLCFEIVALDPHPASDKPGVTHPHVNDKALCAGDAAVPIKRALEQGRIADAFCLVRSVLLNYNSGSPYVPLADWGGQFCFNCSCSMDSEDAVFCEGCNHDFCVDCADRCNGCGSMYCQECQERCPTCSKSHCPACLKPYAACLVRHCGDCLEPITDSDRSQCPRCLQAAAAGPAGNDTQPIPLTNPLEKAHESPVPTESCD